MRLVDRYIARRVFRGYALIMVILASAFSLIALVRELDSVGKGTYDTFDAALYVLLTLPGWMVALSPAMALLGAMVGLGELAAGQELIAMQALGVSRARIAWSVLKTGLLLMLAVMGLQEFVAPKLDQLAFERRTQAISGMESMSNRRGFWSRNGQRVVHVRRVLYGRLPSEIEIYQFDDNGSLRFVAWARQAVIQDSKRWVLHDVRQQIISENKTVTEHFARLPWDSPFTPDQITKIMLPVEMLSPSELYGYVQYLKRAGLAAERPELTLWQSISMPLSAMAMVILAIPYVLGPIRQVSAGKRMLHGGLIGATFHAGSQLTIQLGSLVHLPAPLTTLSPVAVMLGIAVWLYRRPRW
jgi:lipopolysaccharide export system permease protein